MRSAHRRGGTSGASTPSWWRGWPRHRITTSCSSSASARSLLRWSGSDLLPLVQLALRLPRLVDLVLEQHSDAVEAGQLLRAGRVEERAPPSHCTRAEERAEAVAAEGGGRA